MDQHYQYQYTAVNYCCFLCIGKLKRGWGVEELEATGRLNWWQGITFPTSIIHNFGSRAGWGDLIRNTSEYSITPLAGMDRACPTRATVPSKRDGKRGGGGSLQSHPL